jgi:deoxyribodipyrimidine photo-lyase
MRETAAELGLALAQLGQPLIVRIGSVVETLDEIRRERDIAALWSHAETGNAGTFARDRAVAAWARAHGIAWREIRQDGVIRRLADHNGWARRWDATMSCIR